MVSTFDRARAGPGTLPAAVRQTISEGHELPGVLGAYANKVATQAYLITDEDIAELKQAHYTDDQIFEATVSAALGAGLVRLDCVLRALQSEQTATTVATDSSFSEACTPAMIRAVTARLKTIIQMACGRTRRVLRSARPTTAFSRKLRLGAAGGPRPGSTTSVGACLSASTRRPAGTG